MVLLSFPGGEMLKKAKGQVQLCAMVEEGEEKGFDSRGR